MLLARAYHHIIQLIDVNPHLLYCTDGNLHAVHAIIPGDLATSGMVVETVYGVKVCEMEKKGKRE